MSIRARRGRRWALAAVAVLVAGVVLGPALGRGVILAYDMPWSPDPRWTPFVLGSGTPAPRAVPSDAVAVLVGHVLTAALAQKLILLAILAGAGLGAAALLGRLRPGVGLLGLCATTVGAQWNPFVDERLVVGQWTVLLGYAVLPWALRSALVVRGGAAPTPGTGRGRGPGGGAGSARALAGWVALAGTGGANTLVIVVLGVGLVLLAPPVRARPLAVVLGTAAGVAAAWALPALAGHAASDPAGTSAFRPRPDTPLGTLLSLVSGGGFWNAAAQPATRHELVPALAALVVALVCAASAAGLLSRRGAGRTVLLPAVVGLLVAAGSATPVLRPVWQGLLDGMPGAGVLRDSQKLLAPWVLLLALGAGCLVETLMRRVTHRELAGVAAVGFVLLPVALLPTLGWGVGGRLRAVTVPSDYRAGASVLSAQPTGLVGLLPWNQYRRYDWNGSRVSLTLLPRVVDQPVLFDDSLPLSTGRVAGEDPRAQRVSAAIASGVDPVAALRSAGVAYVVVERRSGVADPVPPVPGEVVFGGPSLLVVRVSDAAGGPVAMSRAGRLGWALTGITWLVAAVGAARVSISGKRGKGLLASPP